MNHKLTFDQVRDYLTSFVHMKLSYESSICIRSGPTQSTLVIHVKISRFSLSVSLGISHFQFVILNAEDFTSRLYQPARALFDIFFYQTSKFHIHNSSASN